MQQLKKLLTEKWRNAGGREEGTSQQTLHRCGSVELASSLSVLRSADSTKRDENTARARGREGKRERERASLAALRHSKQTRDKDNAYFYESTPFMAPLTNV